MTALVTCRRFKSALVLNLGSAIALAILNLCFLLARSQEAWAAPEAQLSSSSVVDGGLVLITLRAGGDPSIREELLEARFADKGFPFFPGPEKGVFRALVGVPHSHKSGESEITVTGAGPERLRLPIRITSGEYKSEVLKVPKHTVSPPKKDLSRIKKEQAEIGLLYSKLRREKLWDGAFVLPVDAPFTSPYGTKRMYNGEMQNFHQGLDLKASVGTPIRAPSGGVVVLAKDLFFTGYTVILDHGYGLFTVYAHMSKLKVKKGRKVKAGDLLGLAGMTGRASGPHLHWGAVVQKVKVDPQNLLKVLR